MLLRFRGPLIALVALVHLAPSAAFGQAPKAGVVTTLEGSVTVTSVSVPQPRQLKFRDDVFVNDRVVTGDRSIARMLLGGKAVVTVRERSSLTITEVPGKSTITLDSGKIAVAVAREKVKPGEEIEVRTPNAVAGVRGTVFIAEVVQASASLDADGTFTTYFYGFSGLVTITIGSQVFNLLPNMVFSRIGLQVPGLGTMSLDMRNRAQAGLQTKPQPLGTAGQEAVNEQAMSNAAAMAGSGASAVGANTEPPVGAPPVNMTAPILPGGTATITPPSTPPSQPIGRGLPPPR